jgi:prepilin-type N-terminal cleavage/methylation domain-containing protein/prepilin-type processing-associated H-X9-DG protein
MSSRHYWRGFTLIELLVVIAIIALLVSILVPALSQAKQLALVAKCQTNLKTCGSALYLYAQDNNGLLPLMQMPGQNTTADVQAQAWAPGAWDSWVCSIARFPKNYWGWQAPVEYCRPEATGCPIKCKSLESNIGPYGLNHLLTWGHPNPGSPDENWYITPKWKTQTCGYGYFRIEMTVNPSETYLAADSSGCYIGYQDWRHLKKNNFLWVDGHVRLTWQSATPWGGNEPTMDKVGNGCRPMYNSTFGPQFSMEN